MRKPRNPRTGTSKRNWTSRRRVPIRKVFKKRTNVGRIFSTVTFVVLVNGSPKKKAKRRKYSTSGDEGDFDGGSDSDVEFVSRTSLDVGERTGGRRVAKLVNYNIDNSSNASSDAEEVLFDNNAVKSEGIGKQGKMIDSSDSEADKPLKKTDTSDDLFDSLIGNKCLLLNLSLQH